MHLKKKSLIITLAPNKELRVASIQDNFCYCVPKTFPGFVFDIILARIPTTIHRIFWFQFELGV